MCDKNVKANLFVQKIKLKVRYIIWKKIKWDKKTKCIIRKKKKPLPKWTLEIQEQWSLVLILSSRKSIVYKS